MKYMNVKGLDKPISELIVETAMFSPKRETQIEGMLETHLSAGGNVIDLGLFMDFPEVKGSLQMA